MNRAIAKSPDRAVLLSVSLILVAVPFAHSSQVFDSGLTPKLLALTVGALLVSLSWLRLAWRGEVARGGTIIDVPMCLFLLILALQWPRAYDVYQASLVVVKVAALTTIYLAVTRCSGDAHREFWVSLFVVVGFVVSAIGILQYLGIAFLDLPTAGLPSATFAYRNTAAMFIITVIPFAFLRLMQSEPDAREILWAAVLASMCVFLIYTRTRGAWVGFLAAVVIAFGLAWARRRALGGQGEIQRKLSARKAVVLGAVVVIVVLASSVERSARTESVPQISGLPEAKTSTREALQTVVSNVADIPTGNIAVGSGRFGMWSVTLEMIGNHPLLGVGPTNWEKEYPKYLEVLWGNKVPRRPHNDYLWMAAELGVFGFLAFVGIFVAALVAACRSVVAKAPSGIALAAIAGLAAIQCHALFSFPLERIGPVTGMWFCLCLLGSGRGASPPPSERRSKRILFPAVSVSVLLAGSVIVARAAASEITTDAARKLHGQGEGGGAVALLERTDVLGVFDYRHLMAHTRIYADLGRLDDAYRVSEEAVRRHPNSLNALRNLGETAAATGNYGVAIETYKKAIVLRPVIEGELNRDLGRVYTRMGMEHYQKDDLNHALSYFESAVSLRTDLSDAQFGIGNVYLRRGQKSSAVSAYTAGLRFDPDNAAAHYALGTVYRSLGEDSLAVEHLRLSMRDSSNNMLQKEIESLLPDRVFVPTGEQAETIPQGAGR